VKSVNNGIDPDDLARIGGGSADIGPVPQETLDRGRQSSTPSQVDLSGGCTTLHDPRQDPTDPDMFPGQGEHGEFSSTDSQFQAAEGACYDSFNFCIAGDALAYGACVLGCSYLALPLQPECFGSCTILYVALEGACAAQLSSCLQRVIQAYGE
jgi:hypothetical protein